MHPSLSLCSYRGVKHLLALRAREKRRENGVSEPVLKRRQEANEHSPGCVIGRLLNDSVALRPENKRKEEEGQQQRRESFQTTEKRELLDNRESESRVFRTGKLEPKERIPSWPLTHNKQEERGRVLFPFIFAGSA